MRARAQALKCQGTSEPHSRQKAVCCLPSARVLHCETCPPCRPASAAEGCGHSRANCCSYCVPSEARRRQPAFISCPPPDTVAHTPLVPLDKRRRLRQLLLASCGGGMALQRAGRICDSVHPRSVRGHCSPVREPLECMTSAVERAFPPEAVKGWCLMRGSKGSRCCLAAVARLARLLLSARNALS